MSTNTPARRRPFAPSAAAYYCSIIVIASFGVLLPLAVAFSSPPSSFASSSGPSRRPPSSSLSASSSSSAALLGLSTILKPAVKRGARGWRTKAKDVVGGDDDRLFSIPSVFSPSDSRPVVLFDGKCNLCNAGVQLVLDNDRASSDPRGNLRVAALQSRVGRILLARLPPGQREAVLGGSGSGSGSSGDDGGERYKSIVVAGPDRTWINSDACLRIGRDMRGPLRYLAILAAIVPRFLRDAAYRLMSRHRGRLFGRSAECRLWDDNWDTRFVDDAIFGGRGQGDVDPFADPSAAASGTDDDDDYDDDWTAEEAPPGTPAVRAGDRVRVVSPRPILHTHVEGHEVAGICSVGLVGTVTRVLDGRAYPKNVAVMFELSDGVGGASTAFEAHFFPGQLRKEQN